MRYMAKEDYVTYAEIYIEVLCPPNVAAKARQAVKQHFVMGFEAGKDCANGDMNPAQFRAALADFIMEESPRILTTAKDQ